MKKPWIRRLGDFAAGKGFYIVLFLCVAAIGISGYYLFSSLGGDEPAAPVAGNVQVTVTPTPRPSAAVTPSPSAAPRQSGVEPTKPALPSARPTPTPTPSPTASAPTVSVQNPAPEKDKAQEAVAPAVTVYTWPVKGEILQGYAADYQVFNPTMGDWRTHDGIDIAAEAGTQVKAAANGTVSAVEQDDLMGTVVTIDHGNGVKSVYANLAEVPTIKAGDVVKVGDVIGSVGSTAKGESLMASHLHFEMAVSDLSADPADYLPEQH